MTLATTALMSRQALYQLLSDVTGGPDAVHPGLARLLGDPGKRTLVHTLETYLDLAANAEETARTLHLHRTTLYYRLRRIEILAQTDLKDGEERLLLHLACKLARAA